MSGTPRKATACFALAVKDIHSAELGIAVKQKGRARDVSRCSSSLAKYPS
jgi:hypothetical protein